MGAPVPKFGEWDVNEPASSEGYSQIFDNLRNEKKGFSRAVASQQTLVRSGNSQRKYGAYTVVNKFKTSFRKSFKNSFNSVKKKWVSCIRFF